MITLLFALFPQLALACGGVGGPTTLRGQIIFILVFSAIATVIINALYVRHKRMALLSPEERAKAKKKQIDWKIWVILFVLFLAIFIFPSLFLAC